MNYTCHKKLSGYWKTSMKISCCFEFALTTQGTVWEFYPRSSFEMIYGRKTVLRIIYILEKGRCHQFPSLLTELFLKANNTGLGTAGIDKFSLTNIIFLNLITFGHSIALIVLGEIICWSLLKIRINAGSDKVYSIQLVCFCSQRQLWTKFCLVFLLLGVSRWHWPWTFYFTKQ